MPISGQVVYVSCICTHFCCHYTVYCLQTPFKRITQAKVIKRKKVLREQLVDKQAREADNYKLVTTIKTMLSKEGE